MNPRMNFPAVEVWETSSRSRYITNVDSAAHWLVHRWPADAEKAPSYFVALEACLSALEGKAGAEDVRHALIAAATEANILGRRTEA